MKAKLVIAALLCLALVNTTFVSVFAVDKPKNIENSTEDLPPIYDVFANVGYGGFGWWGAVGMRYSFIGLSAGLSAMWKSIPNASSDNSWIYQSHASVGNEKNYTKMIFHTEASFYHDFNPKLSVFVSIGCFFQSDSIFAQKPITVSNPDYTLYRYKAKNSAGLCFGAGFQYFFENQFGIGIGYHTKNGFYMQGSYYWE
jgi:hypothetical protein